VYCPNCGTENTNNASFCIECNHELQPVREPQAEAPPPPPQAAPPPQMASPQAMAGQPVGSVPNYLVQAILVTIFCCLPLGIVSIVFAAQVNGKLAAGDYYGAVDSSNRAKMWCWWSFGLGLGFMILYMGFIMLTVLSGLAAG